MSVIIPALVVISCGGGDVEVSPDARAAHMPRMITVFQAASAITERTLETFLPDDRGEITLLAVGDVNLGRTLGQYIISEGPEYPFAHLRDWIESFDIAFCNLECPISDQDGQTVRGANRLIFTAPPGAEIALKNGGWDIVSTANNHCNDYGISALKETMQRLDDAGVAYNGTAIDPGGLYKPTYVEVNGYRLAFIAVTHIMNGPYEGTRLEDHLNWADREKVGPAIEEAERNADFTLLSYHGGIEYTPRPTRQTRDFFRWAVDHGVDIVLGHHPHFFQTVEWYGDGLIIYSLGNFTFYQGGWMKWSDYGMAASLTLGEDGIVGAEFIPIRAHYQASVIDDEELRDTLLDRLFGLSGGDPSRDAPD